MTTTNYAVSPGEYLEEWIEDHDLTQSRAATLLGCSRKQVNAIINGHAPITASTATQLARLTNIPACAWMTYEANYRADLARIADEEHLAQYADQIAPSAATYLRQMGMTTATMASAGKLVSDFLAFHQCGTWDAYLHLHDEAASGDYALAALKDSGATLDRTLLTTWLRAAELDEAFERGRFFSYDSEGLVNLLPRLRARAAHPDSSLLGDLAVMLADVGVVLMTVQPPKKLPLFGMTRWIDKRVPVIQQTGRRGKDGFFIWTLFHEIGHVLNDPRGEMHLEYRTEKKRNSSAEKAANEFALKLLFGDEGIAPFHGLSRDSDIAAKAREIGISPGVAVHQMHRRKILDYRYGNNLFVDLSG